MTTTTTTTTISIVCTYIEPLSVSSQDTPIESKFRGHLGTMIINTDQVFLITERRSFYKQIKRHGHFAIVCVGWREDLCLKILMVGKD